MKKTVKKVLHNFLMLHKSEWREREILEKYSLDVIRKALKNTACQNPQKLIECCQHYQNKA